MSTPTSLSLPDNVRRTAVETSRGTFAALEAMPGTGVCERDPAVLVPGYTGSKEDFLNILRQLAAAGRRVIAIDQRGQYQSPGPDDPRAYEIGALAADVAAIVAAVGARVAGPAGVGGPHRNGGSAETARPRPVHVVGHSFGGLVVRETALAGAPGIESLTFMSSGPGQLTGPAATELTLTSRALDGNSPEVMRRIVREVWDGTLGRQAAAAGVSSDILAFLRERMLGNSPVGLQVMARYLLHAPDRTAELADRAEVPLLVLYGEDDDKWEPAAQEDMAAQLEAERICIPGAAHSPAVDAPETTASALSSFWHAAEAATDGRERAAERSAQAGPTRR